MQELIKGLRGELINCGCHAFNGNDCWCDCIWPEHVASKAADLIESQAASIEHYKSGLTSAIQYIEKYKAMCD